VPGEDKVATSRGVTMVVAEQSAEQASAANTPAAVIRWRSVERRLFRIERECSITDSLVGTVVIVVVGILLKNVVEVAAIETDEMVQTFAFDRAHPRLSERIRIRRPDRRFHDAGSGIAEQPIEVVGELRVAIPQKKPGINTVVRQPHLYVASLLFHPMAVGVIGCWADEHLAATQVNEEQAVSALSAERREHVLGEEIASHECVHVQADELAPRCINRFASTARWGKQPGITQQPLNRRSPDGKVEFLKFAHHASVSPVEVLPGETKDEPMAHGRDSATADAPWLTPTFLLAQPSAIGLARDDAEDIVDVVPEFMADAEQGGPIFGTENDVIAARLAAKDGDLEHEEPYVGVTASTKTLDKEMQADLDQA
jgi:hypothetical protein